MDKSITYTKNARLGSKDVKDKILKYLYSCGINVDAKHQSITNMTEMDNIRDNDYIICPRFGGTRSWIIFFNTGDEYYAVNFPKHSQRKREDLQIHPIDINVSKKLYRGTIMEGIFFRMDEKRFLVIDEVYQLSGENQLLKSKDDRLTYLTTYLKKSMQTNLNYSMYVSQYYSLGKKSLKELYEKIKDDTKIQEIIFYPKIYGKKIYIYTILDSDLIDNVIKISQFKLQKTGSPDVYNLISTTSGNKIDIAYIPDFDTSKKCKQWFKDYKTNELLVKCRMDIVKKLWIPVEIIEEDVDDVSSDSNDDSDDDSNDDSDGDSDNSENTESEEDKRRKRKLVEV